MVDLSSDVVEVPDGLIDTILSLLESAGYADDGVRKALESAADIYVAENQARVISGEPKAQKKLLAELIASWEKTALLMYRLAPEYAVAVADLASRLDSDRELADYLEIQGQLLNLSEAGRDFLARYSPRRGPHGHVGLELAMREVLPCIETACGHRAEISWNKQRAIDPTPRSEAARIVLEFFMGLSPRLSSTAIFNMIEKVRITDEPSEGRMAEVISAHFDELDASLLVGRKGDH